MSGLAVALRLDSGAWLWLEDRATWTGSTLLVLGTYLAFAFDRLGAPDFALRATARFVLVGLYGWIWLAAASWAIAAVVLRVRSSPRTLLRMVGHVHIPLLLVAGAVLIFSVLLPFTGIAMWPAVFVGGFWMPAMLVSAVAAWSGVGLKRAVLVCAVPYVVWAAVVGRYLWHQVGHLL